MSQVESEFVVSGHPEVVVRIAGGDVSVRPGEEGTVGVLVVGSNRVLEGVQIEEAGGIVSVRSGRGSGSWFRRGVEVALSVPEGCDLTVATPSGDVRVTTDIGEASIDVASGDVRIGRVRGRIEAKSVAGSITVDEVAGGFALASVSGDVRLGTAQGGGSVATASGDIAIGQSSDSTTVSTVSGDIGVGRLDGSHLGVKSMSGDIGIGFPPGRRIDADVNTGSGTIRNLIEPGSGETRSPASLRIRSVSGDVVLHSVE